MIKIKNLATYAALILVSLIMLFGISRLEKSLDEDVKTYHLRFTGEIKNAPAWVTFTTVALGSFRGILADILWLRQMDLKMQGSYFEMVQLSSWITKLQPQFAGSAVYLGWEMAYNLSVTCSNFEDRWRWIQEGTKLLRDEAMLYNPEDVTIYYDLARIYFQKYGNTHDDAHLFYKNKFFIETSRIIGKDPDWAGMVKVVPNFRIVEWNQQRGFFEHFPVDGGVWKTIQAAGFETYESLLQAYEKADGVPESLDALPEADYQWLDLYLRAAWIWDAFRLNPHRVAAMNKEYGNLDWRTPESQAIYWSLLGLEFRPPNQTRRQLDNIIALSLQASFRSGRPLVTDPDNMTYFIAVPNFEVLDRTLKASEEAYKNNADDDSFLKSRNYFLRDALVLLYNYGQTKRAQEMYDLLKENDPGMADSKLSLKQLYDGLLAEKVEYGTVKDMGDLLVGTIYCALHYWVLGDQKRASELENAANYMYAKFEEDNQRRLRGAELPPMEVIRDTVIDSFLKNAPPQLAERLRKLMAAAKAKAAADADEAAKAAEIGTSGGGRKLPGLNK